MSIKRIYSVKQYLDYYFLMLMIAFSCFGMCVFACIPLYPKKFQKVTYIWAFVFNLGSGIIGINGVGPNIVDSWNASMHRYFLFIALTVFVI